GAESSQRGVDLLHDGLAGQPRAARAIVHLEEDLGGQHHVLTPGVLADRPPDDLLRAAVPVDVGGVPEGDAEFHGLPEDRLGRLIVQRPLVDTSRGVPETHATQGDPADLQARGAQAGVLHCFPSVPLVAAPWSGQVWTLLPVPGSFWYGESGAYCVPG